MFVSGDFWDESPSWFLKKLKLPSFYAGNFKIFKNALGQFIQSCSPKHVITSTNTCADEASSPQKILILTPFSHAKFCKFLGFLQKQVTREIQNQNLVSNFLVCFGVKTLTFAKINLCKISKSLYSLRLVHVTLVCSTVSCCCWAKCFTIF